MVGDFMKILNTYIQTDTFFKKGIKDKNDDWGIYTITGYQGSGKTYFAVYLSTLMPQRKIITNIRSLSNNSKEIEYFNRIEEIYGNVEENVIFIIDEISNKYSKDSKTDKLLYRFLQQSRKRKRIVIMISQELKEIPMWLRRPCRFIYTTYKLPIFPLFITTKGDGTNLQLDENKEWVSPIIARFIYKRNKRITDMYDTYDPINEL